ncbi:MAG: chemotaxis protein CheW [Magnetococcales bacterium]|nr:chemotaxis protein CheW [Magnetococcales bacterium]NGZ27250.1 chemotaxis protein CheW [Magnetococcales bacterium]
MVMVRRKTERVLTFTLDRELYAIDIHSVREILDISDITRIPQTLAYMLGVVNLRGNAVPVMDLRHRFGLPPTQQTLNTRIIIIEQKEDKEILLIGALADSVKEVLELDQEQIDPPPRMGSQVSADYIRGIGKQDNRFIILLDANKVFSLEDMEGCHKLAAGADILLDQEESP